MKTEGFKLFARVTAGLGQLSQDVGERRQTHRLGDVGGEIDLFAQLFVAQQIGDGVIVGIGLNVAMNEIELPVPTATSLALSGSNNLDRNTLLIDFLSSLESIYAEWESGADFLEKYRQISSTLGRQVRVEVLGRDPIEGEAVAISAQGALILRDGFEVNVGDVVHLR